MLTVKTLLAPDAFGGTGLFAADFIKSGTRLWSYDPAVDFFYTLEDYVRLPLEKRKDIGRHVYPTYLGGAAGIMYSLDNDRYMNHSEQPNAGRRKMHGMDSSIFDARNDSVYALADIPAGGEITANYFHFLPEGFTDYFSEHIPLLSFLRTKS